MSENLKWWEHPELLDSTVVAKTPGGLVHFQKRDHHDDVVSSFWVDLWSDEVIPAELAEKLSAALDPDAAKAADDDGDECWKCGEELTEDNLGTVGGDGFCTCADCDDGEGEFEDYVDTPDDYEELSY